MLLKVPIQQTVLGTEEEGFKMKRIFVFLLIFKTAFLFSQSNDKPNFVIIFCDDLGYGDIGVFGSPIIRTPNIDMMVNNRENSVLKERLLHILLRRVKVNEIKKYYSVP